ncbi:MAG: thiamine-phosphate kinase [Pirellulaceae bacterium]
MERQLVQWLKDHFGDPVFAKIGIGDDCAVLPATAADCILTADVICDGTHFQSSEHSPEQIGRKALAVNLSDLAAMGAEAKTAIVSMTIPRSRNFDYVQRLFLGMQPLLERYNVEIAGGDTTVWDGALLISVTALGLAPQAGAWTISGAKPGDRILVTGAFGGSIRGHHLEFEPRLDFARQWRESGSVNACTDVSDSLSLDLAKIAEASGVGCEIDAERIPVSEASDAVARTSSLSPLRHALSDGEDFELIVAVSPEHVDQMIRETDSAIHVTDIGCFTDGEQLTLIESGQRKPLDVSGYIHVLDSNS